MRIHSIELSNVRGIEHLKLSDIPDTGVIVISGENEAGKSTIVEALQVLKNYKHSTKSRDVLALQPKGKDVGVEISMRATIGPHTFSISKTFLKKRKSELIIETPRRESLTGELADARFQQLMVEYLDEKLMSALLVEQGQVDAAIMAAGIPTLTSALARADGTVATGEEDTALMQAVDAEYSRFFSKTGKTAGELLAATRNYDTAAENYQQALETKTSLDRYVALIEQHTTKEKEATAGLPQAEADYEERKQAFAAAKELQSQKEQARVAVEHAKLRQESAAKALQRRQEIETKLREFTRQQQQLDQQHQALSTDVEQQQQALACAEEQVQKLENRLADITTEIARARLAEELDQARRHHAELTTFLADLDRRDKEIAELRAVTPLQPLQAEQITEVEEAETNARVAQALLSAQTATLSLTSTQPTEVKIGVNDITLGETPTDVELLSETELAIGNVRAIFTPAAGETELRNDVRAAQHTVQLLLSAHSVDSLEELKANYLAEQNAIAKLDGARNERAAVLGGKNESTLRDELADLDRFLAETPAPAEPVDKTHLVQLQEQERQLTGQLRDAQLEQTRLRATVKSDELSAVAARLAVVSNSQEEQQQLLHTEQEAISLEQLQNELQEAEELSGTVRAKFTALEAKAQQNQIALAEGLLAGAQEKVATLREMIVKARLEIAENKGRIEQAEGAAENLIKAGEARAAAQYKLDSVTAQAESAKLLRETLIKHRDAARQRYAAPFATKLTEMAHTVFGPGVEFVLNEQLQIEERVLDHSAVSIGELSGGAQEQLGILTRFAIAEMASEQSAVPIFVDDALGNTDSNRLEMMNFLFSHMGKHHQVFVLTCMPSRYDNVRGKTELSMQELKSATE